MDITINRSFDDFENKEDIIFVSLVNEPSPVEDVQWETPDEMIAFHQATKQSAIDKLKLLGLTEEEAKAIAGV